MNLDFESGNNGRPIIKFNNNQLLWPLAPVGTFHTCSRSPFSCHSKAIVSCMQCISLHLLRHFVFLSCFFEPFGVCSEVDDITADDHARTSSISIGLRCCVYFLPLSWGHQPDPEDLDYMVVGRAIKFNGTLTMTRLTYSPSPLPYETEDDDRHGSLSSLFLKMDQALEKTNPRFGDYPTICTRFPLNLELGWFLRALPKINGHIPVELCWSIPYLLIRFFSSSFYRSRHSPLPLDYDLQTRNGHLHR